jgi:hypothetical protein
MIRLALDSEFAIRFSREWVQSWNDHDLDAILAHYAENVVLHSPRIRLVTGRDVDSLAGADEVRAYWSAAMGKLRDLFFEIDQVLVGSDALTIIYTNERSQSVAETFVFNPHGLVTQSIATYA